MEMKHEAYRFGKEESSRRLQIPIDRIDVLAVECGMPFSDEAAFLKWAVLTENSQRILAEKQAQFNKLMRVPEEESVTNT